MLWDKHLFIRNMTEPLKGSAACVCPYVPEVCVCASTAQTAQRVAQKEACSRPGRMHSTNSRWGCGDNSHSTVFDMTKKHTEGKSKCQLYERAELPCSTCIGFHQDYILTACTESDQLCHI